METIRIITNPLHHDHHKTQPKARRICLYIQIAADQLTVERESTLINSLESNSLDGRLDITTTCYETLSILLLQGGITAKGRIVPFESGLSWLLN